MSYDPTDPRLMDLEVVKNWTDDSYGGEEARLIKGSPMGTYDANLDVVKMPHFGSRHVRKQTQSGSWEHSEMVLVEYLGSPAWIHLENPSYILS